MGEKKGALIKTLLQFITCTRLTFILDASISFEMVQRGANVAADGSQRHILKIQNCLHEMVSVTQELDHKLLSFFDMHNTFNSFCFKTTKCPSLSLCRQTIEYPMICVHLWLMMWTNVLHLWNDITGNIFKPCDCECWCYCDGYC